MSSLFQPAVLGLGVVLIATLWLAKSSSARRRSRLPPGPDPQPVLGNALQIPTSYPWLWFTELAKTYGDVIYMSAVGQPIIVLSSAEACSDLLVKQSTIYSGRPRLVMLCEIIGWGQSFLFAQLGQFWQGQRKLVHKFLGPTAMPLYHPIVESSVSDLVKRVVLKKTDLMDEAVFTIAQLILRVGYGIKLDSIENPMAKLALQAGEDSEYASILGNFFCNLIPSMKYIPSWFPFANFQRLGAKWRSTLHQAINAPFDRVKAGMADGTAEPSFCSRSIEDRSSEVTEDHIKWAAGSLYVAAARTTMSTMGTFLLAMIMHPEIQAKAQAELDRVIGSDNLPTLADRPRLPYLECVFKEVLRWHPAAPTGIPHMTTEDSEYRGWLIPKNSIVITNIWAISHDESLYPSPEKFIPERYEENPDLIDYKTYTFGYGRRVCPGRDFAEAMVWTTMVTLLSSVHMRHALDESGVEIPVREEYEGGGISAPLKFPFRLEPRSPHMMTLLQESSERL